MKTIGVVIPVFNEQDNVGPMLERLEAVSRRCAEATFRYYFVNDGSNDRTGSILDRMAATNARVSVIHLSRNFGHQAAVTAGLDHTDEDIVCLIDGDLQDPPEVLVDMIHQLEDGCDIVYGLRTERKGETWAKKATAKLFYRLLSVMTKVDIPPDAGDFRVMRRDVVDVLRRMRESHRFIRGMVAWTGFRSEPFSYIREARGSGVTKYSLNKMIAFALDALFSFSDVPLKLASYAGLVLSLFGFSGIIYVLAHYFIWGHYIPGLSVFIFVFLIISGMQLILLGIIGQYVGRVFEQGKGRPLYVVRNCRNMGACCSGEAPTPGHLCGEEARHDK